MVASTRVQALYRPTLILLSQYTHPQVSENHDVYLSHCQAVLRGFDFEYSKLINDLGSYLKNGGLYRGGRSHHLYLICSSHTLEREATVVGVYEPSE